MTNRLELCRAFVDAHPADAARVIERLPASVAAALFDAMPASVSGLALEQMTSAAAADCLARMTPGSAALLVAEVRTDLAATLLRRLDPPMQAALLDRLAPDEAGVLRTSMRYPEGTAGAILDPRVPAVAADMTAGDALAAVRRSPRRMLYYVYVVDRARHLVGVVDVPELILARARDPMGDFMHRDVAFLLASAPPAAVVAHPGWRQFHALPVVDDEARLLGAIRYQTLRRLEDEARQPRTDVVATAFALGELYWLGLSGLLDGIASAVKRPAPREDWQGGVDRGAL